MVEFTERERQVLVRLAAGRTSKEIARDLTLSVNRVNALVLQLRRKLGAANRTEAVGRWVEQERRSHEGEEEGR
ncbi:MAG: helix-turn-helix transcriptional regulator [Gemmataceae bacterium]|nr:helix-turn-helix transcriptional regulator [Gemmataceae bacterium]